MTTATEQGTVKMQGKPLTLTGKLPQIGRPAPDFTALNNKLEEVKLSGFRGKTVLIAAVPSLDTSVCNLEARRLDNEFRNLGENVVMISISMDLPFANERWCGEAEVSDIITLSDHRDASFGKAFGVLVKELRLLARSMFVVDPKGKLTYVELVEDLTMHPNYEAALAAVRAAKAG